jgi:2-keto-4-pentenoate hydratase
MMVDGVEKATGGGVKCPLGSPLASVTWCINHLAARGIGIAGPEMIISGATCKTRDFKAGQTIEAQYSVLDSVSTTLTA